MFKRHPLLAPEGSEGGGTPTPARKNTPPAAVLDTAGISDSLEHLDLPEGLKAAVKTAEKTPEAPATKTPTAEEKAAAELAARAEEAGRTPEEQTEFEKQAAAAAPTKPEFTADQEAWLKLRSEAKTPEEIAQLDKEIPEFNQEQADWINAEADRTEKSTAASPESEAKEPEFTAEQKPFVEKLTADLTETQTKLAAESKRVEQLTAQVTELQSKGVPAVVGNIPPLLLTDNPADIDAHEKNLESFIEWGRANWDGAEAVPANGDQPAQRAYTAQEIRTAVTRREQELRKLVPAARNMLQARQNEAAEARKIYPALFDAKAEENKLAQAVLKQWPMLKAIPNHLVIIGDAIAGKRERVAKAKSKTNGRPAALRVTPKSPVRASAGGTSKVTAKTNEKPGPDVKKFMEARKTEVDEITALAKTLGD